ncbi:MAG: ABC transporter substrate-binding protein [Clostridia bacterium]|nr:ABC transporter substrate-binding protein [Clostridia bacterium]
MKKIFNLKSLLSVICVVSILALTLLSLTGCSAKERLYLFNYGDYIDPQVYDLFEQEYGIEVVCDEYAAPEDMYAKFVSGSAKYDLICTSDYILEKLIGEERLAEINIGNLENFSNISEKQLEAVRAFDPDLKYTVPHFWGTVGILYNTETVKREDLKSWKCLFDGSYKGQIVMPNSERDAFFVALSVLGYDANTTNEKELREASELLKKQKADVQAYLLDEAARVKVESENADLAVIYNGEAYLAFENNGKLDFAVPEGGTCVWLDCFAIPKDAVHQDYAELFLDFLCREDVAAMNFDYIYYSTPNQAVIDALDSEILSESAIFPDDSTLEKCTVLKYLGAETEKLYSELWKNVKS